MIVLRGAVSQWKRSDWLAAPAGPPPAPPPGGPAARLARRDRLKHVEVPPQLLEVDTGSERQEPLLVDLDVRLEVGGGACEEDDADVEKLLAVNLGHNAHDGVAVPGALGRRAGVRAVGGHSLPPPASLADR